jgi:hypothetical protein
MAITRLGPNTVNLTSAVTGTLPAANGGSGRTAVTGNVLQVVSSLKTAAETISTDSDNGTNISGLSATITPSSTSSKIFITASVTYSMAGDTWGTLGCVTLARGSTLIGEGGNNQASQTTVGQNETSTQAIVTAPITFLDSPSTTSATTYNVQIKNNLGGTQTMYVNATKNGSARGSSTITVMEIAG